MRYTLTILAALFCVLIARPAAAQFLTHEDRGEFILLTTTTTSAVAVGVIMLTVANVRKDPATVQRYLRHNEPAVRSALALGAGSVVADLEQLFGVSETHRARFAALLRRHRGALNHAAFVQRDAQRFIALVDQAMAFDSELKK